jgi:hypothetical protein
MPRKLQNISPFDLSLIALKIRTTSWTPALGETGFACALLPFLGYQARRGYPHWF